MSATDVMLMKAAISIGTQGLISRDVNLVKVAGDTFFTPIVGSAIGNSSNVSTNNLLNGNPTFIPANENSFRTGMLTDLTFGGIKSKIPVGNLEAGTSQNIGKAVIDATAEINSQVISNKMQVQENCNDKIAINHE